MTRGATSWSPACAPRTWSWSSWDRASQPRRSSARGPSGRTSSGWRSRRRSPRIGPSSRCWWKERELPTPDELPHGLLPLRTRHAHAVRPGSDWERNVRELAEYIASGPRPEPQAPPAPAVRRVTGADPTFDRVARGVSSGRVVIVLGPQFNGGDGEADHVPDAPALARRLAGVFGVEGDVEDLAWVSQQVDATEGRPELLLELETALDARPPSSIHHSLARLAQRLRETRGLGHLIVTANYDTALEQAFDALHVPYDLAVFVVTESGLGRFCTSGGRERATSGSSWSTTRPSMRSSPSR